MTTKTKEETMHDLTIFYTNKIEGSPSSKVEEGALKDIVENRKTFVLHGTVCINEDKSAKTAIHVMMVAVEDIAVKSTNLSHVGYQMDNKNHGYFYILFKGKEPRIYIYYDVLDTVVLEAYDAESIGKYAVAHITKKYSFDKII